MFVRPHSATTRAAARSLDRMLIGPLSHGLRLTQWDHVLTAAIRRLLAKHREGSAFQSLTYLAARLEWGPKSKGTPMTCC